MVIMTSAKFEYKPSRYSYMTLLINYDGVSYIPEIPKLVREQFPEEDYRFWDIDKCTEFLDEVAEAYDYYVWSDPMVGGHRQV